MVVGLQKSLHSVKKINKNFRADCSYSEQRHMLKQILAVQGSPYLHNVFNV